MRWPWTGAVAGLRDELAAVREVVAGLESRVAELGRRTGEVEPTAMTLPPVVRAAIDRVVPPFDQDRQAIRIRGQLIRGARVRLKAGRTDAEVLTWIDTTEDA